MKDVTVFGIPGSPYVRSVLLGLEEKSIPWRLTAMAPADRLQPAHLARHPFGRVPAFAHGDFQLYETQAILRYLDRIVPDPALIPADPVTEARMNQLCGITDWYVMPQISQAVSFGRLIAPKFGLPVDDAAIRAAAPRAARCLAEIARLLGGQMFMAGAALSLADLMLTPQLSFFAATEEGAASFADHPGLAAWLARMEARPSFAATRWERVEERARAAA